MLFCKVSVGGDYWCLSDSVVLKVTLAPGQSILLLLLFYDYCFLLLIWNVGALSDKWNPRERGINTLEGQAVALSREWAQL